MSNKLYLPIIMVSAIILGACNQLANQPTTQPIAQNQTTPKTADTGSDTNPESTQDTTQGGGQYLEYSEANLATATANNGTAVHFFHADWCPTCRAADNDINDNLSSLPENITILKTDFDSETELKEKYGVVGQHTFVQVDAGGNEITKWNGGGLEEIIENIQQT